MRRGDGGLQLGPLRVAMGGVIHVPTAPWVHPFFDLAAWSSGAALGWGDEIYERVKAQLLAEGAIAKRRGRGGGVARVRVSAERGDQPSPASAPEATLTCRGAGAGGAAAGSFHIQA